MRDRKNWAILNAKVLVARFLTYPAWIGWIRTPASIVEHCFSPPSWQEWMKFLEINWNWSLLLIAFSMSLLRVFKRTIGWNILGDFYKALWGLEMIIDDDILQCNGQCPKLMHVLAMLIKLLRQVLSLTIALRCF